MQGNYLDPQQIRTWRYTRWECEVPPAATGDHGATKTINQEHTLKPNFENLLNSPLPRRGIEPLSSHLKPRQALIRRRTRIDSRRKRGQIRNHRPLV